jgi:hypothetical protein
MKISRATDETPALRSQRGSAVLILLILLDIMLVLVAANYKSVVYLQRELRWIDRRQIQRWNSVQTNATAVLNPSAQPNLNRQ